MAEVKKTSAKINPYFIKYKYNPLAPNMEVEIFADAEADEFWSYVGIKNNQRWTWYDAIEKSSGILLAYSIPDK